MTDRNFGEGPFEAKAAKALLGEFAVGGEDIEPVDCATVFDATGNAFCYIAPEDCAGRDMNAAKARATRIAEALNRDDRLKAALMGAREIIQMERDTTVECATKPPEHDISTLDDETRPLVETFDAALAQIDEALR